MTDQDTNQQVDDTTGADANAAANADANVNNSATSAHDSENWEARYKSLQTIQQKKREVLEKQIDELTQKNEQAILDFNEKKQAVETFEKQQAQFLQDKSSLETQLKQAQDELKKTNHQVTFQKIILAEFPNLSDMIDYIPSGETEDDMRTNAKAFAEKMKSHVDKGVKQTLDGSSSTPQGTDNAPPSSAEEDKLWDAVYASAGRPGKEEEYRKAYQALQDFLDRKSKQ